MPVPREEQESVITAMWGADTITFSTSNPAHFRAMTKLGYAPTQTSRVVTAWRDETKGKHTYRVAAEWDEVAWTFTLPAECFKLPRPKRKVSDAQRQAAGERLRAAREKAG